MTKPVKIDMVHITSVFKCTTNFCRDFGRMIQRMVFFTIFSYQKEECFGYFWPKKDFYFHGIY